MSFLCACARLWATVDAGERAVMFNRIVGVKEVVIEEGTHFRVPWFDTPHIYDVRTRPHTIKSLTGSKGACGLHCCCAPRQVVLVVMTRRRPHAPVHPLCRSANG